MRKLFVDRTVNHGLINLFRRYQIQLKNYNEKMLIIQAYLDTGIVSKNNL